MSEWPEKTATAIRYSNTVKELAYQKLSRFPEEQAEAIAKHYVAHAFAALTLLKLINDRRNNDYPPHIEYLIAQCLDEIKRGHQSDLGITLEWP